MGKFINPFSDVGFKRIFGQEMSKPLLLDFLNNLLIGERHITDLRFLDKEQPAMGSEDRSLIYDIYCETDTGEKIIVEMQNRLQPHFKERTVFYAANSIVRQGERGIYWVYDIKAVYCVSLLNFRQRDISSKFRTDVALMDMSSHEVFTDKIRLIYLQLPLFTKEVDECENDFERWIYVLKNMETLNRLPFAAQSAVFKELSAIADIASLSKEERRKYDKSIRIVRDTIGVMEGARLSGIEEGMEKGLAEGMEKGMAKGMAEGMAKGMAEGMEKGRSEAVSDVARELKKIGTPIGTITKVTGLTREELARL